MEEVENQLTEVTATVRRLYVYGLSLFGLVMLALGVGSTLQLTLEAAYRALFGPFEIIAGQYRVWNDALRSSIATAVVGGGVWWWHWLRAVHGDTRSTLRSVYLYLLAILGGAATAVVACTVALYHLLQWFFGRPQTASALDHFDVMPALLAAAVVGGGIWGYHWSVTSQEAGVAEGRLNAARRVYFYLVSAVGLVTFGTGLVILLEVFFGLIGPAAGPSLRGDLWRNPLVLSLTLLLVGAPIWWVFWRRVQRLVAEDEVVERGALSRRVFIYATFGASILLTLFYLSNVLFNVFDVILGGRAASALLWDSRWPLAIVLTAGVISGYYWSVLQEDRKALVGAAELPGVRVRKNVVVLASEADSAIVRRLETLLGQPVTLWHRLDQAVAPASISDEELTVVAERINAVGSDHVLLLVDSNRMLVVPYSRCLAPVVSFPGLRCWALGCVLAHVVRWSEALRWR
jgi:hypothetical protein